MQQSCAPGVIHMGVGDHDQFYIPECEPVLVEARARRDAMAETWRAFVDRVEAALMGQSLEALEQAVAASPCDAVAPDSPRFAHAKRLLDALDRPFLRDSNTNPITLGWRMGARGFADWCNLSNAERGPTGRTGWLERSSNS